MLASSPPSTRLVARKTCRKTRNRAERVNPAALPPLLAMVSGMSESFEEDFSQIDAACDHVFAALAPEVQDKINARARETLPPFLQNTLSAPGAMRGMEKERRATVWIEHKQAVYDALANPETVEASA